ncbi:hypothetical protein CPTMiller_0095 [Citrobacter phage Miller]|uniref:Uncharacterized protein n=1 Tax=Citrobacter phage Miller TaxID=1527524 RepID=A0A076YPB3_9CAUD|nr:hypothetical protein CPTMiller_0095 [Citrobacter phage Miller]AIK68031.1 hypothetical protein CPTMiller_0095 [Citrobacter phage Miller]
MKPVILTDIDGIAVKWQSGLPFFLSKHNMPTDIALDMVTDERFRDMTEIFGCDHQLAKILMEEYNNSSFIRYLSAYDDALIVINRLKAQYDFVAVTALGTTPTASLNRIANLNTLFPSAFKEVCVVGHGETKVHRYLEAKAKYGDRLVCFIDDLAVNLNECHNVISQLPLFHMLRGERSEPSVPHTKVNNWHEIEKAIENS